MDVQLFNVKINKDGFVSATDTCEIILLLMPSQ